MGAIANGIMLGFLIAIVLSTYVEQFFPFLPIFVLYGIFAPFLSAIIITLYLISDKRRRRTLSSGSWTTWEEWEKQRKK